MHHRLKIFLTTFLLAFLFSGAQSLREINDEVFLESLKNQYLLVFFTKPNCEECTKLDIILEGVAEPLKTEIKADTFKITNSQLSRLYSPNKEPAIVFFRHGIGMLIDVDDPTLDTASLYQKLSENVEPSVKELTDATFEHLTQASTGATTGDWLVNFYSTKCVDCQRLNSLWEGVASELKHRMNVARINIELGGVETGKRFNVQKTPEFILIRQGKYYKYEIKKYDIKSFVLFATQGFKNAKQNKIRPPSTPFDDLVAKAVEYLRAFVDTTHRIREEQPYFFLTIVGLLLILMGLIFARQRQKAAEAKAQKPRRRKGDKSK